jgi:hypothetical protein
MCDDVMCGLRFLSNVMVIHLSDMLESQTEHEWTNQTFFSLHGHVQALAALVGLVPALECGVPLPLLDVCTALHGIALHRIHSSACNTKPDCCVCVVVACAECL